MQLGRGFRSRAAEDAAGEPQRLAVGDHVLTGKVHKQNARVPIHQKARLHETIQNLQLGTASLMHITDALACANRGADVRQQHFAESNLL